MASAGSFPVSPSLSSNDSAGIRIGELIAARITALDSELQRTLWLLDERIAEPLRTRVLARLSRVLGEARQDLNRLAKDLPNLKSDESARRYRAIREQCDRLFRECLAVIEGSLFREAGADGGLCRIADSLIDDLSRRSDEPWGRFTILGEGEYFGEMAEIIRLRFPENSIWSLPLAAHEFGHFFARSAEVKRNDGSDLDSLRTRLMLAKKHSDYAWRRVHEHFADLFATYAIGPAFACVSILLRFDPESAWQAFAEHPPDADRAEMILLGLRKKQEYRWITDFLEATWRDALAQCGQKTVREDKDLPAFKALWDELDFVFSHALEGIAYDGWLRAVPLQAELSDLNQSRIVPPPGSDIADVLNAAWSGRLKLHPGATATIDLLGQRAFVLCDRLAA